MPEKVSVALFYTLPVGSPAFSAGRRRKPASPTSRGRGLRLHGRSLYPSKGEKSNGDCCSVKIKFISLSRLSNKFKNERK